MLATLHPGLDVDHRFGTSALTVERDHEQGRSVIATVAMAPVISACCFRFVRWHAFQSDLCVHGSLGRLTFALYDSIVPDTVQNFAALCNNQCSTIYAESKGKQDMNLKFGYAKNKARFFRVVPGFTAQCGMLPLEGNKGHISQNLYGRLWPDENFSISHDKRGILSMANKGPNTNGSQFFITLDTRQDLA